MRFLQNITLKKEFFLVTILLLIFSGFFFFKLTEVGLEYDEALFTNAALNCKHPTMFLHSKIQVGEICLPIMVMQYLGATQAYALRLAYSIFGVSLLTLRSVHFVEILMSLVFIYLAIRKIWGKKLGLLTLALLVFDSQLLLMSRYDRSLSAPFIIKSLVFYFLSWYLSKPNPVIAGVLGILVGLLVYTKSDGIFLLLSILTGSILFLFRKKKISKLLKQAKSKWFAVVSFSSGVIVGLFPFLFYLLHSGKDFIRVSLITTLGKTVQISFFESILIKIRNILIQLSSYQLTNYVFQKIGWLYFVMIISAILILLFFVQMAKVSLKKELFGLISLVVMTFYFIVLFYPSFGARHKVHHLLIIYPLPQIIVADFLLKFNKPLQKLKGFIFLYLFIFIFSYSNFHYYSAQTCGVSNWSCEISKVVEEVKNPNQTIAFGDWGLATQVFFYTQGSNPINEVFFLAHGGLVDQYQEEMRQLTDSCALFIVPTNKYVKFEGASDIVRNDIESNAQYREQKIDDRQGNHFLSVYQCK